MTTRSTVTGRLVSEAKERFTLARIGAGSESPDTLRRWDADRRAQSRAEVPTPLSAPDRDVAGQRASWTQILGSTTTESLLADLRTLDASGAKNDAGLFTKLCALFNLRPKATRDIAAGLSSANPDQISLRLAVAAMGEAASEAAPDAAAAEQTLREMLSTRRTQPDAVLFLAPALASAQVPQPETLRLLQTVAQDNNPDIAMPAALAMGRLAHACPPAMARNLVRFLTQRLATSGEALRVPLLAALGNAGSAESLAAVAAYTRSSSPLLRGAAYLNLRFVPGERVMTLIQRGLSDPDSGVRLSAARALQFRPFSARDLQVVANALAKEGTDSVRLALLENVNLEAPYYPQATRSILGRASTKDASAEIRRTVSGWLRPAQG